jgi:positive regulator of sigma E activity
VRDYTRCGYEVPGMILLRDLILVKLCLCMVQLAPATVSTHERQLCGSCGSRKTCVFLRLVAKMKRSGFRVTNQH